MGGKIRFNCNGCGQFVWVIPYRAKKSTNIHCSVICRNKMQSSYLLKGAEYPCYVCGDMVYRPPSKANDRTICSKNKCKSKFNSIIKGGRVDTQCSYCGADISIPTHEYDKYEHNYCNKDHYTADMKLYPRTLKLRELVRQRKRVEELDDGYVRILLSKNTNLVSSDIPHELVKLKRKQLKLYRSL